MDLYDWTGWGPRLGWTAGTLAAAWAVGYGLGSVLLARAARWRSAGQPGTLESSARLVRRRLPWWFLLAAAWLATGYWDLTGEVRLLIGRGLFVVGAVSVTLTAAMIASRSVDAYAGILAPTLPVSSLTRNVVWSLITVIGLLVVLNRLGLSIAPMLTALGVGGLAVALALQEPLANFFAGVFITLAGQVRLGDYVKLDTGQEGYVVDFSWRSTRLRMLANNLVVVPNAKLAQAIVVNHHLPSKELVLPVDVGVYYASDLEHVERVTIEVAREVMTQVQGGVPDFEPFIRYHTFGDSSIDFSVILRANEFVDQYLVKHEFVKRLHARFNKEGISIPFPTTTIAVRGQGASEEKAVRQA